MLDTDTSAPRIRPKPRRWRTWIAGTLLSGLLISSQFGYVESIAFYVPTHNTIAVPVHVQEMNFKTSDDVSVNAWFLPAKGWKPGDAPRPAVLFCHGNGGQIAYHMQYCEFLAAAGMHVMLFDYRGYGASQSARRVRSGLMRDARAALEALRTHPGVDPSRIGLYGMSLGGVFASALAAENPDIKSLCTLSAFSSWRGVASDHVPILGGLLIPGGLDPIDSVARLGGRPYLLIHGTSDNVIPVRHAYLLRDSAQSAGTTVDLRIAEGGDHSMLLFEHADMHRAVEDFFMRTLGTTVATRR